MPEFILPASSADAAERRFSELDPFIIAEIGVNHDGDLERAKDLVDAAARGGAHAAKFQTYTADKLAARTTSPAYWDTSKEPTKSQYELFSRYGTMQPDDYAALAAHCADRGVVFLSTPFDLDAVEMLEPLMPVVKVASADLTNVPLQRRIRATGKPVIMSVGASTHDEIQAAVERMLGPGDDAPVPSLTLLHCVLNYPTPHAAAQLGQIRTLQQTFGDIAAIGYSDHVRPNDDGTMPSLEIAVTLGAVVIEKHFTDDKQLPGNDHYHSMDEHDLAAFVARLAEYRTLWGGSSLELGTQSAAISHARRRVVAARAIGAGTVLEATDLIALRSNVGIEIAQWDSVLGRRTAVDVAEGEPLEWSALASAATAS